MGGINSKTLSFLGLTAIEQNPAGNPPPFMRFPHGFKHAIVRVKDETAEQAAAAVECVARWVFEQDPDAQLKYCQHTHERLSRGALLLGYCTSADSIIRDWSGRATGYQMRPGDSIIRLPEFFTIDLELHAYPIEVPPNCQTEWMKAKARFIDWTQRN